VLTSERLLRRLRRQTTICSGLLIVARPEHSCAMGTKSRESIYGGSIRASAERAAETRKNADRLASPVRPGTSECWGTKDRPALARAR
jgi:hypothetical protein